MYTTDTKQKILEFIRQNGSAANAQLQAALGISSVGISKHLRDLINSGQIIKIKKRYYLNQEWAPPQAGQAKTIGSPAKTIESESNTIESPVKTIESQANTIESGAGGASAEAPKTIESSAKTIESGVGGASAEAPKAIGSQTKTIDSHVKTIESPVAAASDSFLYNFCLKFHIDPAKVKRRHNTIFQIFHPGYEEWLRYRESHNFFSTPWGYVDRIYDGLIWGIAGFSLVYFRQGWLIFTAVVLIAGVVLYQHFGFKNQGETPMLGSVENELTQTKQQLAGAQNELTQTKEQLAQWQEQRKDLEQKIKAGQEEAQKSQEKINQLTNQNDDLQQQINKLGEQIKSGQNENQDLQQRIVYLQEQDKGGQLNSTVPLSHKVINWIQSKINGE